MIDGPRGRARGVVTIAIATVGFALALALRAHVDAWSSTAIAAVIGIALSAWTLGPRLRALLAITWRGAVAPVALGVTLVAATHAGFQLVRFASPGLAGTVRELYASIDVGASRPALALLTAIIVLGEELVWRGVAVDLVSGTRSKLVAGAISVALYVLPQLPGHVPVLILAAAALGSVFAAQRIVSGRITDAALTHAIWSISVFVVFPVS